ncbi:MAG: hypothetical protein H0U98_00645 [Alphaproteobacteria bacterium]|nr:hypothetical protein [Alphaproteobacteria bacterium]
MSESRSDTLVIAGGLLAWPSLFAASAQGKLHVSGMVSDGLLAVLAALIAYRLWRACRRGGRNGA